MTCKRPTHPNASQSNSHHPNVQHVSQLQWNRTDLDHHLRLPRNHTCLGRYRRGLRPMQIERPRFAHHFIPFQPRDRLAIDPDRFWLSIARAQPVGFWAQSRRRPASIDAQRCRLHANTRWPCFCRDRKWFRPELCFGLTRLDSPCTLVKGGSFAECSCSTDTRSRFQRERERERKGERPM
jgi:hypothetical protein